MNLADREMKWPAFAAAERATLHSTVHAPLPITWVSARSLTFPPNLLRVPRTNLMQTTASAVIDVSAHLYGLCTTTPSIANRVAACGRARQPIRPRLSLSRGAAAAAGSQQPCRASNLWR